MPDDPPSQAAHDPARADQADPSTDDLYCPRCDYNLRGLTGERCPECGHSLDWARLRSSQIPWVHRARYGLLRSYWRTVWWVTFRRRRLGNEIARPVSYPASQKFRWISILHAYVAFLGAMIAWYQFWPATGLRKAADQAGILVPLLLGICALPCLAALTGVPSYYFHAKGMSVDKQNRAIALSYYTCGVLAWLPLTGIIFLLAKPTEPIHEELGIVLTGLAILLLIVLPIKWWLDLVYLAKRITRRSPHGFGLFTFGVPVLWLLVAGLILVGLPLIVLYVAAFFVSLSWS